MEVIETCLETTEKTVPAPDGKAQVLKPSIKAILVEWKANKKTS